MLVKHNPIIIQLKHFSLLPFSYKNITILSSQTDIVSTLLHIEEERIKVVKKEVIVTLKKFISGAALTVGSMAMAVIPVMAAHYTLGGDASIVSGGNPGNAVSLVSSTALPNGYSTVDVSPTSPITWADLDTLSTDFNVTDDSCGGGSPRITLGVDTNNDAVSDGNVHIAMGPSPSFSGCTTGWQSTGNLIGNADAGRYDFSQFGGSPFTTYSAAPASVLAGSVVSVDVVVDGSWSAAATGGDSEQTVLADNITVNAHVTTFDPVLVGPPTDKETCKKGGWMTFNNPTFKNQGQCVSSVQKAN